MDNIYFNTTDQQLLKNSCISNTTQHILVNFVEKYVSPGIFIIGIITNIITFLVLHQMSLGKILKILLCVLCVSDLLASLSGLLNSLLEMIYFDGDIPFGYFCPGVIQTYTTYFIFLMFLSMSQTIVIMTSVVRVYSMVKPFKSRSTLKVKLIVKMLIAIFTTVLVLFLPVSFYILWQSCFEDRYTQPLCTSLFTHFPGVEKTKLYLNVLLFLFGPLMIVFNLVSAILIRKAMMKSVKDGEKLHYIANGEQQDGSQMKKCLRITRLLFYILLINTLCIIPTCVQSIMLLIDSSELVFKKDNPYWAHFDVFAEILLQVIPCYNFWTYLIVNKDFKRKLQQLIFRKNDNEMSSTTSDTFLRNRQHITASSASLPQGNVFRPTNANK